MADRRAGTDWCIMKKILSGNEASCEVSTCGRHTTLKRSFSVKFCEWIWDATVEASVDTTKTVT